MMQRRLGIKRSFHCEDLSSIDGLNCHPRLQEDDEDVALAVAARCYSPRKRQRAISMDASASCSAVWYCCNEEVAQDVKFMTSSASSDDHESKKTSGSHPARLISPATSHVAVTPPEMAPEASNDELSSLPRFPSLRTRTESRDFPATAALERFMLKQRCSPSPSLEDDDDFSPSIEGHQQCEEAFDLWPNFDQEKDLIGSPHNVEDFALHGRRISMASRKSSSTSVQDSSNHASSSTALFDQAQKMLLSTTTNKSPVPFPSMASSCNLHPTKAISHRPVPTVNQITEALAKIET